jgi:2,3-bisphosphoglycerate-dependent phosphoglycerate mutase
MHFLMVRHAESVGNREYRIQGRVDYVLSEQGVGQAHALGQFLADHDPKPTHIYTSPLSRTVHTAEILRDYWATRESVAQIALLPELQEVKNGVLDGLTWAEAKLQHPELCATLMASKNWIPIPGAESLKACRDRAGQVIRSLISQHHNNDQVWLVSHGGFLQYLIGAVLGSDRIWGLSIPPTALFEFELDCDQWNTTGQNRYNALLWRIRRFNEVPHLKLPELPQG